MGKRKPIIISSLAVGSNIPFHSIQGMLVGLFAVNPGPFLAMTEIADAKLPVHHDLCTELG